MTGLRLPRFGGRPLAPAPTGRERTKKWRRPLAGLLAGGLVLAFAIGSAREARATDGTPSADLPPMPEAALEQAPHPREKTYLKRQWGVEVMDVQQTAAGYMLEFRYRVVDAEKAKPLFERRIKPVLTHVETGTKLTVPTPPTTGALRNSNPPIEGRIYWMFFGNPAKLVKPGQRVNVEIGDFRADGLVVR